MRIGNIKHKFRGFSSQVAETTIQGKFRQLSRQNGLAAAGFRLESRPALGGSSPAQLVAGTPVGAVSAGRHGNPRCEARLRQPLFLHFLS